jgi:polygalacturonase
VSKLPTSNRREFLKKIAAGSGAVSLSALSGARVLEAAAGPISDPWAEVPKILARIKPPTFPNRDFDVTKYGAVGDNKSDSTEAIRKAIADCTSQGGGRVVVPKGEFMTGAVELKSNVNLYVSEGATLRFSRDPGKYPLVLTHWEGNELMNYASFLYAHDQENIGITGKGTIDGNADQEHWWSWKAKQEDRDRLHEMAETNVPVRERVFGQGHYLRPQFIQPFRCKNILIEGVRLLNSPMWQVTPCLCTNVTVKDLYISAFGPNTDGCDPESCTDVLIDSCFFNTGDDCIAIKSGRNADGRRLHTPSENLIIRNCHMKNGHGGVTVGSEISGGCRNVFADNCNMDSPQLNIAIRVKNNAMRGGLLENIHARNITVGQVSQAVIAVDFNYEEGKNGKYKPVCRNLTVTNLKSEKSEYAVDLQGFENAPVENVTLRNCEFNGVAKGSIVKNVHNLQLKNVRVNGKVVERLG